MLFQELKLTSWDGGSWAKDIMRRLIQSLPNLEVLAIHTASAIIDVTNEETIQKWGRIDALVNNAGTTKFVFNHADLDGLDADDFLHIYKVNVVGPFQMVKACKEMLMNSENPSVVNISSIAGIKGIGSSLAYASSKGALNIMTKSMARNLGPIRVNAICPGFIQGDWLKKGMGDDLYNAAKENLTSSTPLKLTVTPEQVAEKKSNELCLFVLSELGPQFIFIPKSK